MRSLKIAKYLLQFGWEPIIYTVDNAQYPILDEGNYRHVPEGITILRHRAVEPFNLYRRLTRKDKKDTLANVLNANDGKEGVLHKLSVWVRANFFIPDARAFWIQPSVRFLSTYLKNNMVDAVFSDGPPHTNTVIAYKISRKFNLPWLMDWQDPWTQVDYYKLFPVSRLAGLLHKRLENKCLKQADVTTIVSPTWKTDLEKIGGHNVNVIPWGFDKEDYDESLLTLPLDVNFTLTHIGLLGEDRSPFTLVDVLADISKEVTGFNDKLRLELYGTVNHSLIEYIKEKGLGDNFVYKKQIPREDALKKIASSQVLLLLLNKADNAKGRIPGKLFEYLYVKRPILNLGVRASDVEQIIKNTKSGISVEYDDYESIKSLFLERFDLYERGVNYIEQENIDEYDIENLTKKIALLLDHFRAS